MNYTYQSKYNLYKMVGEHTIKVFDKTGEEFSGYMTTRINNENDFMEYCVGDAAVREYRRMKAKKERENQD